MLLYPRELLVGKGIGLVQDAIGDGQFADIVQETGSRLVVHGGRRKSHVLGHLRRRSGYALGAPASLRSKA